MKQLKTIFKVALITVTLASCLVFTFAVFYQLNNKLFLFEISYLWPQKPFHQDAFLNGTSADRASMTSDLIKSKKLLETDCASIPKLLGTETGDYYVSDANTTYRLTDKDSESWILTFVCGDDGKVARVFVRKSCCSISQKMLSKISAIQIDTVKVEKF